MARGNGPRRHLAGGAAAWRPGGGAAMARRRRAGACGASRKDLRRLEDAAGDLASPLPACGERVGGQSQRLRECAADGVPTNTESTTYSAVILRSRALARR